MIIWLASYPKSGNTWLRSILSKILYYDNDIENFEHLKKIEQYPVRGQFKDLINNFHDINQIKENWIISQERLNLDNKIKILKTHHINCKIGNYPFTNRQNTKGVIYVVRDPRNVIISLKYHFFLKNYEEAKNILLANNQVIGSDLNINNITENNFLTLIGSWKMHYNSWKNTKENFLLIKYEDLISNPKNQIHKIILYLKKFFEINYQEKKIENLINLTSFEKFKKMEEKGLFFENVVDKKTGLKKKFFNLGPENNWQKSLEPEIKNAIENNFKNEMRELGYL
jgi:hypothetical protein